MCVTKNAQTNCQCVSSQFIASKTQETHSRGNTAYHIVGNLMSQLLWFHTVYSKSFDFLLTLIPFRHHFTFRDIELIFVTHNINNSSPFIFVASARKSYLAMLDPIHHQGLRLALGTFRTSPTASLYVEADEPSLNTRREKLSLQYAIRIAENN